MKKFEFQKKDIIEIILGILMILSGAGYLIFRNEILGWICVFWVTFSAIKIIIKKVKKGRNEKTN